MSSSRADGKMPAFAHTMSNPPWRSTAVATTFLQSSGLVTSAATPVTVPGASAKEVTAAST